MHSRHFLCSSGLALATVVFGSAVALAAPVQSQLGSALRLRVVAAPSVISGELDPVRVSFENQSSLPLWFYTGASAELYFALVADSRGPGGSVALTCYGRHAVGSIFIPSRKTATGPSPWLRPGKSKAWSNFTLGRLYDLTLPGQYQLRVTTRLRLHTITGSAAINRLTGYRRAGSILYWPPPGEPLGKENASRLPPLLSKPVFVTVVAPYGKLPSAAVKPAVVLLPIHAQAVGPWLRAKMLPSSKAMPVMLRVWFRAGPARLSLRLTGNPLADFAKIEATGPSYLGEYTVVKNPEPHDVPYINKSPVLLTAYGKWIAKHPVRGLKWKKYTLKPGMAYKYTEAINLSCQYDMSLAGVYRVRLELVHTHLWSPWATVTVP